MVKKIPRSLLVFAVIIPLILFLQSKQLAPHLKYGFGDIDWRFLFSFKEFSAQYPNPIDHLVHSWIGIGVYTYSIYYMGILEHFFPIDGFNFINIHRATHLFKFLSALTLFPLILILTKKQLLAAIVTILYSVSYSSVGPIYTVGVSGNYLAITVMNLFLTYYIFIVKKNILGWIWLALGIFLFILTLFLSTERLYPLIPLIFLGEFFWMLSQKFSGSIVKSSIKRQIALFSPLLLLFILVSSGGPTQFGGISGFFTNTKAIFQKIIEGNWQLLLNPQISLASLFFPKEYWGLIGSDRYALSGYDGYLWFFLGPFSVFLILTFFLSILISTKRLRFVLINSFLAFTLGNIVYILANHQLSIDKALRQLLGIDIFVSPALVGAFILSLTLSFLIEWILSAKNGSYPLYLFIGPAIAFFIIFLTWIPSDPSLTPVGIHRYLAIPAIFSSFFIASLITLVYEKIKKIKILHNFSWLILLIILPIIQLNFSIVGDYFYQELEYSGMDGAGQNRMKNQLLSYMSDFDLKEPTLFYLDEQDYDNGYFQETAVIAGFNTWIQFRGKSMPLEGISPIYIRNSDLGSETNVYCTGVNVDCVGKLKTYVTTQNGEKGILYKNVFYLPKRFYAFRLKNRDVYDIKNEILQKIGI